MGYRNRMLRVAMVALCFVMLPFVAFAQEVPPPAAGGIDGLLGLVPGGVQIAALVVAIAGVVSVFVPDDKMPGWLSTILNWLALNVGKARNDPGAQ